MDFPEGTFRGWGGRSTGWAGQSENVERLDRKSQAQMAKGFQKPENQLAYDAASVRQVSYLISFPLVQPISTTCMPRKDQIDKVSDATEMVFRTERHTGNYTCMFAISPLVYFLNYDSRKRKRNILLSE